MPLILEIITEADIRAYADDQLSGEDRELVEQAINSDPKSLRTLNKYLAERDASATPDDQSEYNTEIALPPRAAAATSR